MNIPFALAFVKPFQGRLSSDHAVFSGLGDWPEEVPPRKLQNVSAP